jgi:hypothetical protein
MGESLVDSLVTIIRSEDLKFLVNKLGIAGKSQDGASFVPQTPDPAPEE